MRMVATGPQTPHRAVIGVYIHIPFCRTRCPYCDFVSQAVAGSVPDQYVKALCSEIAAFQGPDTAQTVFLGGGTPSLLTPESLDAILAAVRRRFVLLPNAEISLEANPDDVTEDLARAWSDLGVNRLSLGVQSFDDAVLRYLGRRHDAEKARWACDRVAARFENWSMDLIFGAPPIEAWSSTLDACVRFAPKHVSTYSLTYEIGTAFEDLRPQALDEDAALELYREAHARLDQYDHYEISNFAKPGHQCQHNLVYWHNGEYAGFGTGAYSFIAGVRARNHADTTAYVRRPGEKSEELRLSEAEIKVETLIQHFRLRTGISKRYYLHRFGSTVDEDFGESLRGPIERGLIEEDSESIRPTRKGFELNNEIGLALVD